MDIKLCNREPEMEAEVLDYMHPEPTAKTETDSVQILENSHFKFPETFQAIFELYQSNRD
jgi:hypothetical protein